ncbi:MAG: UDP-glucose 6-dehydrogenase [Dehalococcoidaceae bacterium]|nr:UDP-glucose 6-dehydrogenase [Dehalococcoidaceae bacterium]|tara:strand:+ start:337 stop:1647 length:1311 start_codon:yes stop_codon:yes gene_type:complete
MNIAVVGLGFVGLSLSSVLASKGYTVIGIDTDKKKCIEISKGCVSIYEPDLEKTLKIGLKKSLKISNDFSTIKNSDMIFVTVGTPQKINGEIELSMIKKAVKSIGQVIRKTKKNPIIFIKSTVIPGTTKKIILPILEKESGKKAEKDFGVISNPEFLQESNAIRDTKCPHAIILGGNDSKYMKKAKKFFSKMHPNVSIIITKYQTAEMIKYANNSFLATKISFINQLSNICQNIPDADVDDVASAIGLDPRIGKLFLSAGPGYGGSCLPKDMSALINFGSSVGANTTFLKAVKKTNDEQINNIISLMEKKLGSISNKKITILGTAFKPNTNDIRDSKSIELIKKLLKNKVKISVYDPKALENTKMVFGNKIIYSKSLISALDKSYGVIIMTQWKQFESINNKLLQCMKNKLIIDSRRMLADKELNGEYYAIGIGEK